MLRTETGMGGLQVPPWEGLHSLGPPTASGLSKLALAPEGYLPRY